jgi:hypothetical protein
MWDCAGPGRRRRQPDAMGCASQRQVLVLRQIEQRRPGRRCVFRAAQAAILMHSSAQRRQASAQAWQ